MRIGSRVIPLPALGAAAAAVIAVIVVAVVVLAGGDDDGDNGGETTSANRTAVSQSRTRVPQTSTAIAAARQTAIAEGTPEAAFDAANPTPSVVPTEVIGGPDTGPGVTPGPGTETAPTQLPAETATQAPTSTPAPPGVIGDVTMDSNRGNPGIDHTEVTAAVGSSFEVGILINDPPGPYAGYQYALYWNRSDGILGYVGEQRAEPQGLTICSEPSDVWAEEPDDSKTGVYGGCLSVEGGVTHTGEVAVVTIRCESAGRTTVQLLGLNPSEPFATSLIEQGGGEIPTEVDSGFDVVCT
jgi:hypothetical protein